MKKWNYPWCKQIGNLCDDFCAGKDLKIYISACLTKSNKIKFLIKF